MRGGGDGWLAPASRRPRSRLWKSLIAAFLAGAALIFGLFLLRMHSVGWSGSFPAGVFAAVVASYGVTLLFGIAVAQVAGAGWAHIGAPHAGWLRHPWVPPAALVAGGVLGFLLWR